MPPDLSGPAGTGLGAGPVWDVLIVGAGPAGSAAAIVLAGFGRRVLLVDSGVARDFKLGESVAPPAVSLVRQVLGGADALADGLAYFRTSGNLAVWSSAEPETMDFFFTPAGHGLCVDRLAFDEALRQRAAAAGASVQKGARFLSCDRAEGHPAHDWQVTLLVAGAHRTARARLLIDASGRQAVVAQALGAVPQRQDALFAYACWYASDQADEDRQTRIEAGPHGWWYSNRLHAEGGRSRRLVVFHADKDSPAARAAAGRAGFETLLQDCVHLRALLQARGYRPTGPIRGAPAHSQRLLPACGPGWFAAGDAAQAYDPLSSQGIWKALDNGNQVGHEAHYWLEDCAAPADGDDPGARLARYARQQDQAWQTYLTQLQFYYGSQPRWRSLPFWQRRQDPQAAAVQ